MLNVSQSSSYGSAIWDWWEIALLHFLQRGGTWELIKMLYVMSNEETFIRQYRMTHTIAEIKEQRFGGDLKSVLLMFFKAYSVIKKIS